MPIKDLEKRKEYQRVWKRAHPRTKSSHRKSRADRYVWYHSIKAGLVCILCGEPHPACLQFHHRIPAEKKYDVAAMINALYAKKRVLEEMAKCDVLCANCHSKMHYRGPDIGEVALS